MPSSQPLQRWKIRQCVTAELEQILNTEFACNPGGYIPTVIAPPHQHCKDWTIVGLLQMPPPPLNPLAEPPLTERPPLAPGEFRIDPPGEGGAGNDDGERTPLIQATGGAAPPEKS